MNKRLLTALFLSVLLAACGGQDTATPAASDATTATDAASATPAMGDIADEPALAPGEDVAAASTAPAASDPASAAAPAPVTTGTSGLVAGRDYDEIPGGQPFEPLNGRIEVVEVFNYVCPACASFQPLVNSWKTRLPADVRFTYVPAAFGPRWDPYARAYYAAESMGIADRTHDAMFNALHIERSLKGERGEDSVADIAAFYGRQGVDAKQFASTMSSFAVDGKFNRAKQFVIRSQTNATPTLIVNGKYRIKGNSFENMLENTSAMIARERTQGSAAR